MYCPYCTHPDSPQSLQTIEARIDTRVVDSRPIEDLNIVKRRRKCEQCFRKFTTYERLEILLPPVVKSDGRREIFQLSKIEEGIKKACQKRPISILQIKKISTEVEMELMDWKDSEVNTVSIGNMVMEKLKKLDQVAYVRFASVYKTFKDVDEFLKEICI